MRTETIKRFADHVQTSEGPLERRILDFKTTRREFFEIFIALGSHIGEIYRRRKNNDPSHSLFSDVVGLLTTPPEMTPVTRAIETAVETAVVYKTVEKISDHITIPFNTDNKKRQYVGPLDLSNWSADVLNKYGLGPVAEEGLFNSAPHLIDNLILKRIEDPTLRNGAGIVLGLTSALLFARGHRYHTEYESDSTGTYMYNAPNTYFPIEVFTDMLYRYHLNSAKGPLRSILSHSLTNVYLNIDNGIRPSE